MKIKTTLILSIFILYFNSSSSFAQTGSEIKTNGNEKKIYDMLISFYTNYVIEISRKPPEDLKK
jgi:hypothetical protein